MSIDELKELFKTFFILLLTGVIMFVIIIGVLNLIITAIYS